MKNAIIVIIIILFITQAFTLLQNINFVTPQNWPKPSYNFLKNPLTEEKIELGRALFYEVRLSRNNTISCASCHSQYTSFTHVDHSLSHGIEDRVGLRNSQALVNLAWHKNFMWDGSINHLDMQALAPISNIDEMGEKIEHVVEKLESSKIYPNLFYKAFGDNKITGEKLLKSISQFLLTLVSSESKYDSVMRHQKEFSNQEKNGYNLFKKNCSSCHTEPLFTNLHFENNGLSVDTTLNDYGRMKVTKNPIDSLKFKVPTLRNIEFSMPYMHDGRFKTLNDVLKHYTTIIEHNRYLSGPLQKKIILSSNEKVDLIAFLLTLTDKKFLFNPSFSFPKKTLLDETKDY